MLPVQSACGFTRRGAGVRRNRQVQIVRSSPSAHCPIREPVQDFLNPQHFAQTFP